MGEPVTVPTNFGIDNLYTPSQCNVTIHLEDKKVMEANSLVLSWNSPVFQYRFSVLGRTYLNLHHHSASASVTFLESLYTGDVQIRLTFELFREVRAMARRYKVGWMQQQCGSFYQVSVGAAAEAEFGGSVCKEMLWVYTEARFARDVLKDEELMVIFMETKFPKKAIT